MQKFFLWHVFPFYFLYQLAFYMAMSVSMLHIKKMLPKPTKSRMSEKYKDGLRQSWGASTNNEETMGSSLCQWIKTKTHRGKVRKKAEMLHHWRAHVLGESWSKDLNFEIYGDQMMRNNFTQVKYSIWFYHTHCS